MDETIGNAVLSFEKKLKSFKQAEPDSWRNEPVSKEKLFKSRLSEKLKKEKHLIMQLYEGYKIPRTKDIEEDEKQLLDAYNLFKAVLKTAEENHAESSAKLLSIRIESPLLSKSQYTEGIDFAYLKLWLYFEQKIDDYVPVIKKSGRLYLSFEPFEEYTFSDAEKKLFFQIQETYKEKESRPDSSGSDTTAVNPASQN